VELALPKSRKARAVFAAVSVSERPVSRRRLCDLFFPDNMDPKASLRWCLSRLRASFAGGADTLLRSDSVNVWLTTGSVRIDTNYLTELSKQDRYGPAELKFLEQSTAYAFLSDLSIRGLAEYEVWRSTMQAHFDRLHEKTLKRAIEGNLGSSYSVQVAHIYTRFAPHSETAWFLLISALTQSDQHQQARNFLSVAHDELTRGQVMETGLLALADSELREILKTGKPASTVEDKVKHAAPSLAVQKPHSPTQLEQAIDESVSSCVAMSSGFTLVSTDSETEKTRSTSGVDYLLSFSVRQSNGSLYLGIQIVHQESTRCLIRWENVFLFDESADYQTEVRRWLAARIEIDIPIGFISRAQQLDAQALTAADYYHLALPRIYSPVGYSAHESLALLRLSLRRDANFAPALCAMAWVRTTHPQFNENETDRAESSNMVRRAIELAFDDAFVIAWAAISIAHLESNAKVGVNLAQRALTLNPYSPMANLSAALLIHYMGDYNASQRILENLDGFDIEPLTFIKDTCSAQNHYQLGNINAAIEAANQAVERNPGYVVAMRTVTASLARSGRLEEARKYARRMVALDPTEYVQYLKKRLPYCESRPLNALCDDLRKAGLPEHPQDFGPD